MLTFVPIVQTVIGFSDDNTPTVFSHYFGHVVHLTLGYWTK